MYLDYIEITNFRAYYSTQRINFGYDETKNLTIILADNGSGKTSLVNALTWCLYGEELHDVKDKSEPIYNLKMAEELEEESGIPEDLIVKVVINFYYIDEDLTKKYFKITRELKYMKITDEWSSSMDDMLIVEETGEDFLQDDIAQSAINEKIPKSMFHYFFFNGATLSNYFDNESENNLKKSVEEISQLDLIKKAENHLNQVIKSYNNELSKLTPKGTTNYSQKIQSLRDNKLKYRNQIKSNYEDIDLATNTITDLENKLLKIDSNTITELTNKRKNLESTIETLENEIDKNQKSYQDKIIELYPIIVLFDELVDALKIADEAQEKKTAPPQIEHKLLNEILEDGSCICGIRLEEHPECIAELKNRLKKTSKLDHETFYNEYYDLQKTILKTKDVPLINTYRQNVINFTKELNENNATIESINEELGNSKIEQVELFEKELQKNKDAREKLRSENKILERNIINLDNDIKSLEKRREETVLAESESKILQEKIIFSENALDELHKLNFSVQEHIRNKINNHTKKQFTSINWAYGKYQDVNINSKYQISITKSSGHIIKPGDLSDGEENLLALSFMMALHSLSGFDIPLIIDASLEKLDTNKRLEFISGLHDFTNDKQIVFLFTDTQYTDEVRTKMLNNVYSEYKLKPSENRTEIVKNE